MVVLIDKLTDIIITLLKKVLPLVILLLAFYWFLQLFDEKLVSEGFTTDTLFLGLAGFVVGCAALLIAVHGTVSFLPKVHSKRQVPETASVVGPAEGVLVFFLRL